MKAENFCMGCMSRKAQGSVCPKCGWKHGTDPESPLYLAPGSILNKKYIVGRVLGAGGFGITYLAWDKVLDIKLCIKEFLPRDFAVRSLNLAEISIYTGEAQKHFQYGLEKFFEEGRALATFVNHPGIVSVRDYFKENNTAYLVMLYLEGRTLKEYLEERDGKIDYDTALKIMMPVMDVLKEFHKIDMLHLDISPDNIYITKEGQVKLLDFGGARYAMGEHSRSLPVVLKPGYAPEEQYRSKGKQGPWTDIYAVGATLYKVITGTLPPEALDRLDEDTLELPSQSGVIISAQAEQALLKAVSVRAGGRFQRMDELQNALMEEDLVQGKGQEYSLQGGMGQEKAQETSMPDNSSSGPVSTTFGTVPAGENILKAEKSQSKRANVTGSRDNTSSGSELSKKKTGRIIIGTIAVVIVAICAFVFFNIGKGNQAILRQETKADISITSGTSSETMETPDQVLFPIKNPPKYTGEKISLDLYETDIKNVLRILRTISGENFAVDRDVTGNVTLALDQPVPWDQVLDLVLKMNGLGKVREGNIIRIATLETLTEESKFKQ